MDMLGFRLIITMLFISVFVYVRAQPPEGSNPVLKWQDEFSGVTLNPQNWTDRGESYRKTRTHDGFPIYWRYEKDNAYVEDGKLVLKNTKVTTSVDTVLAAGVSSVNLFESTYGYYEARIKIAPTNDGCHTAFWLQSKTMGNVGSGGSDGAEIDIVESAFATDHYQNAIHWDGYGEDHRTWGKKVEASIHDGEFHNYGLEWGPGYYKYYFDGQLKSTYLGEGVSSSPEYIILSTGASWGEGNAHTGAFPNYAYIDWVRVYDIAYSDINNGNAQKVSATDDTYAYGADAGTSKTHGNESTIIVKQGATDPYVRLGFLKFDISTLTNDVESVKLQVTAKSVNEAGENINFNVSYINNDNWTEQSLTWDNKPSPDGFVGGATIESGKIEWDITSQYLNNLSDGKLSFQISSSVEGPAQVDLYSTEAGSELDSPQLIIKKNISTSITEPTGNVSASIRLYPNPVKDRINILYHSPKNRTITIVLRRVTGETMLVKEFSVVSGQNNIQLATPGNINSGIYLLTIHNPEKSITQKLVVENNL
ncbi:CBM96 family carbohydrate-binding protein [Sunxiuqinia elliptica]|uniref:Por secretion system C-terminal sorting domain-containing protein n=1 Tax=Sunxiuqinia elliptica TaxID=655355 RepID=A0A1I2IAP9_9BACT|nr:family 16 glycosylhydrolase [Sunxiuqinia elliptica]SFF38187.1 Por secretion system C-terminal sorting domain-containing protein [Sunxiuqinia elliptica]